MTMCAHAMTLHNSNLWVQCQEVQRPRDAGGGRFRASCQEGHQVVPDSEIVHPIAVIVRRQVGLQDEVNHAAIHQANIFFQPRSLHIPSVIHASIECW